MLIVYKRPPMFDEIDAVFHIAGQEVIFAWGHKIYNPEHVTVGPELVAHETVHGLRQGDDPESWWRQYLYDPVFRLAEELPAHRAELSVLLRKAHTRNERRFYIKNVALKLAAPLYGTGRTGLVSFPKAKSLLQGAACPSTKV